MTLIKRRCFAKSCHEIGEAALNQIESAWYHCGTVTAAIEHSPIMQECEKERRRCRACEVRSKSERRRGCGQPQMPRPTSWQCPMWPKWESEECTLLWIYMNRNACGGFKECKSQVSSGVRQIQRNQPTSQKGTAGLQASFVSHALTEPAVTASCMTSP